MYYLIYGSLYLVSLLPLRVLYWISDFAAFIVHRVIGYRKKVVADNLQTAFPEKSAEERQKIANAFYRDFTDNFIETIKLLSASETYIKKHFTLDDAGLHAQILAQGRKCQLHLGHQFNWEFANLGAALYSPFTFIVVYMPIENKAIDRLFMKLRSRTGTVLLPATNMSRAIIPYRNSQYELILLADQAPGNPSNAYWLNFFGRPAPLVRAPERGARIADTPVVFADMYKIKRGYYHARLEMGCEHPKDLAEGELTRRYIRFLEQSIREHPSTYLWSHRRWKHGWKKEYASKWIDTVPMPAD